MVCSLHNCKDEAINLVSVELMHDDEVSKSKGEILMTWSTRLRKEKTTMSLVDLIVHMNSSEGI